MMISLLQAAGSERVLEKAAHIAQVDPHGFILTIVSVAVVFCALILLFIAYSITGAIFTGYFRKLFSGLGRKTADPDEAAAVALAIDLYLSEEDCSDECAAAVATALHLYLESEAVHDNESGIITIKRQ